MWILQGLLVCCAIMGLSRLASAQSLQEKINQYRSDLKEELRIWKIDNKDISKDLTIWKKDSLLKLEKSRDEKLKKIEDQFIEKIENLGKTMRNKSRHFELKSDLALIKSIKFKREKFNLRKKVLEDFYKNLDKLETDYMQKKKAFRLEAFKEKLELLNERKPNFFPDFSRPRKFKSAKTQNKWNNYKKQFCQIQHFYNKQKYLQDLNYTQYETVEPAGVKVKYYKNLLSLAKEEVDVLEESYNGLKVMIDQIGKTPKEFRKVQKQLSLAKSRYFERRAQFADEEQRLTFLQNALKTAKSKRKSELGCNTQLKIAIIKSPTNLNEHQRIGELY